MKPVTQLLRAYIEPDKFHYEGNPGHEPSPRELQEMEMVEIKRFLGPEAWPWFGPMLIFDCETTTGLGQKLRFGMFQLRGKPYRKLVEIAKREKKAGQIVPRSAMDELWKAGLFYDPAICTEDEISLMKTYAETHSMEFMTKEKFTNDVFYKLHYIKAGRNGELPDTLPCMVIGHNLPFDLGALSIRAAPSRDDNYGGLTLTLQDNRPGLTVKKIGFGKHIYGVHQSRNARRNHRFIDTLQLSRALFGAHSGAKLGDVLVNLGIGGITKGTADYHGPITEEYLDYCCNDVEAAWRAYDGLRALYCKHGVSTPIDKIYSEASLGKAYLKDLGVKPFFEKNPDFDRRMIGPFMEGLYGGRSEVRWRHEIREGMLSDFKGQYSAVNALMKLQDLNIAERVVPVEEDWRGSAACMLKDITFEILQVKEAWPLLRGVALVRPNNDILPVRTDYEQDDNKDDNPANLRAQQIGVNVVVSGPPSWYAFADVIASKLLTGRCPEIIRTITLKPVGVQEGLKEFRFFGDPEYTIDLRKDDLFQRFIDMRSEIKRRPDFDGNASYSAMEQGIKLTSSATSYGVLIEFVVEERKKETATTVYHGADATRKVAHAPVLADDGGLGILQS
jgi:DNA polymerase III epsilon subunit-like protein